MGERIQTHFFHILLTNYCNQGCPFCYASRLMASKRSDKEMSLEDFTLLVKKLDKQPGLKQVKILGGEPTLHSRFGEMMDILFQHVDHAGLFTNGIFTDETFAIIKKYVPRLKLTINAMTPGYQYNAKIRNDVTLKIRELAPLTAVSLSVIVHPGTDTKQILDRFSPELLKDVSSIRIGLSNPVMGDKNTYEFSQFPMVGRKVMELVRGFRKKNKKLKFQMDCGFTRCMFSPDEYKTLLKQEVNHVWGCFQGNLVGCLDVQTDMKAFTCYSLSETPKVDIKKESLKTAEEKLFLQQLMYQERYIMEPCKSCEHRTGKEKCMGPCIGFKMNALSTRR